MFPTLDAGADQTDRCAWTVCVRSGLERCSSRRERSVVPFFVVTAGRVEVVRPSGKRRDTRHDPWTGSVHRRSQYAFGPPRAGSIARQRVGRSDRAGSRTVAGAGADRQRAQRADHARFHRAPGGADRARARRCRARWVESLLRNAPRQRVPDAQRPSLLLHRSRPRRRRSGIAGSVSRHPGGCAGADLPRRGGAAQPDQPGDRGMPRLQRGHRPDPDTRRGHRRRGTRGTRGGRVCRVGRTRCSGAGDQRAGGTGRFELEDRELSRLSHRHLGSSARRTRLHPGAEVRRAGDDREGRQTPRCASASPTPSRSTTMCAC